MIGKTIQMRRTLPNHQLAGAHPANRLFQVLEDHSAMLLTIQLNLATTNDPWSPFSSEADFNLASWFVWNKVAKSQIDAYFADGLGGTDARSFRSAYTMRQHIDELDPFGDYLVWTEAAIDDGQHATTFYYQNVIDCVRFLIRQVAYRSEMVYPPVREYNSSGERLYSEMHTADWWWDTQV